MQKFLQLSKQEKDFVLSLLSDIDVNSKCLNLEISQEFLSEEKIADGIRYIVVAASKLKDKFGIYVKRSDLEDE